MPTWNCEVLGRSVCNYGFKLAAFQLKKKIINGTFIIFHCAMFASAKKKKKKKHIGLGSNILIYC